MIFIVHTCGMLVNQVPVFTVIRVMCFGLLGFALNNPVSAQPVQPSRLEWTARELLSLPPDAGQIFEINASMMPVLFWPEDVTVPQNNPERPENLLRMRDGLYVCIDGTGMVYRIAADNGILFTRIDSSRHSGYNFNAYHFVLNDTLFSLGGYGYWRHNGHLRYYNSVNHGWEIIPLNREVPVTLSSRSTHTKGIHLNRTREKLHYIHLHRPEESLKTQPITKPANSDSTAVFELDLRRHDWKQLGTLSAEFYRYFSKASKAADLPWGELVWTGPKSNQEMFLINYGTNELLELSREKASHILLLLYPPNSPSVKSFTAYADSSLVIVNTQKQKQVIPLSLSDFTPTGIRIYSPRFVVPASLQMNTLSWIALLIGLVSSAFAFTYFYRTRRKNIKDPHVGMLIFDPVELELLGALYTRPSNSMLTEEINFLLGTNKKSLEVQKKHRSDLIKSINEKYTRLTGDTGKLITQERLEDDRRLMKYVLHLEKYQVMMQRSKAGKNGKHDKTKVAISPPEPSSGKPSVH